MQSFENCGLMVTKWFSKIKWFTGNVNMIAQCKNCVGVIDQERNSVVYLVVLNESQSNQNKTNSLLYIWKKGLYND